MENIGDEYKHYWETHRRVGGQVRVCDGVWVSGRKRNRLIGKSDAKTEQNKTDDWHPKSPSEAVEESSDEASRSGGVGQWPATPLLLLSLTATSSPGASASSLRRAAAATDPVRRSSGVDRRIPPPLPFSSRFIMLRKLWLSTYTDY
nr:hypothetical protein Itr_chr08CG09890 [Ipomoea trifida]GLL46352.1 hypothetical protein Itr_chr14CG10150 [Ipomoea trifida]